MVAFVAPVPYPLPRKPSVKFIGVKNCQNTTSATAGPGFVRAYLPLCAWRRVPAGRPVVTEVTGAACPSKGF